MIQKEKIFRFIERKASLSEQKEVLEWIQASPQNRKEFARLKNLSVAVDILALEPSGRKNDIRKAVVWTMRIAAVLVVAVSLFLFGERVQENRWRKMAAGQFVQVKAPEGEILHFTLPDGSEVVLNSGSTLKFSQLFNDRERDVYLQGEGYFDVKKDAKRFNVVYPMESPLFKLSVLGTSFNISSYEGEENIVTTLYDGAIEIEDLKTKESFTLKSNDKHVYERSSGKSAVGQFTETYKWTDKYVVARNEDISAFTARLEEIFNVKIIVDESLIGNCSYTGALYGGSLQQILDNMTFVSPIKYSIKDSGKTVVIERK